VETKYTFIPPSTDEQNKITVINGKSEVIITEEQLSQISQKVKNIRTQIVG
jgi:hypothetical protein